MASVFSAKATCPLDLKYLKRVEKFLCLLTSLLLETKHCPSTLWLILLICWSCFLLLWINSLIKAKTLLKPADSVVSVILSEMAERKTWEIGEFVNCMNSGTFSRSTEASSFSMEQDAKTSRVKKRIVDLICVINFVNNLVIYIFMDSFFYGITSSFLIFCLLFYSLLIINAKSSNYVFY